MTKKISLSIVIPAYNEEHHLKACLDAIAKQTAKPDQVIVVDNNSTDKTTEIARSYSFVKVLHEKQQHQTFAQRRGFDAADSDILARIDADTIIPPGWVSRVLKEFSKPSNVVGVTGGANPYDVPLKSIGTFAFGLYHNQISSFFSGHTMLWGANMAITRETWQNVRQELHFRADIWEDYELSFALAKRGNIKYLPGIRVGCSFRVAHQPLIYQAKYQLRSVRTFSLHVGKIRTGLFALAWFTMIWVFPFAFVDRYLWKWRNRQHALR